MRDRRKADADKRRQIAAGKQMLDLVAMTVEQRRTELFKAVQRIAGKLAMGPALTGQTRPTGPTGPTPESA